MYLDRQGCAQTGYDFQPVISRSIHLLGKNILNFTIILKGLDDLRPRVGIDIVECQMRGCLCVQDYMVGGVEELLRSR